MSIESLNRPNTWYVRAISPVEESVKQYTSYIMQKHNVDSEKAKAILRKAIKMNKSIDPVVEYNTKNYHGDMEVRQTTLKQYLQEVNANQYISAPSLTAYKNHKQAKAITGLFLNANAKRRSSYKKKKFIAILESKKEDEVLYDNVQKRMKVVNNASSGMQNSNTTVFYNPTGHSSLTSTTRCVSGIGNSLSESIVGGNKYFKDSESTLEYVVACATCCNRDDIQKAIDKYKINIPTPHYILACIKATTSLYWCNEEKEQAILDYLLTLDDIQLCAVAYINDLYRFREMNSDLCRDMVTRLATRVESEPYEGYEEDIKVYESDVDIEILTKYLCSINLKGKDVNFKKMKESNDPMLYVITKTARNVYESYLYYLDLMNAFFYTKILPPNLGYIKDMYRVSIVISDTDSTCCAYDEWVEWYTGEIVYNDLSLRVASAIMSFTSKCISHGLKILSKNINTSEDNMERLAMKNEFHWPTFTVANISKHYFAMTTICEGVVYPKPKREAKGVNILASKVPPIVRKTINDMMDEINLTTMEKGKISLKKYIDKVAEVEKKLIEDFENGKPYMFVKETIKGKEFYKLDETQSKYRDFVLWSEVFESYYGTVGTPPYVAYSIPMKKAYSTPSAIVEEVRLTNPEMADALGRHYAKYNRKTIGNLTIPKLIADKKGIPKEIRHMVDIKHTVNVVCAGLYIILGGIGYLRRPNRLVYEAIDYSEKEEDEYEGEIRESWGSDSSEG